MLEKGPNGEPPLLTDFTFDNLGVPRNPENPWYAMPASFNPDGRKWLDQGLGEFLASRADYRQFAADNYGKQKVPSLRNVDKRPDPAFVKAYMHNGYFKTLKGLVHFYNTRDTKPACRNPFTTEADALAQGLLAGGAGQSQRQQDRARRSGPDGCRGERHREIHADAVGRLRIGARPKFLEVPAQPELEALLDRLLAELGQPRRRR